MPLSQGKLLLLLPVDATPCPSRTQPAGLVLRSCCCVRGFRARLQHPCGRRALLGSVLAPRRLLPWGGSRRVLWPPLALLRRALQADCACRPSTAHWLEGAAPPGGRRCFPGLSQGGLQAFQEGY